MRNSLSHPLQIAEVVIKHGYGKLGITFCPGKRQAHAASGVWFRDLDTDIKAISEWNATAIVTLVTDRELDALGVNEFRDVVTRYHMDWYHLPINDGCAPDFAFEERWTKRGEELRARLRDGANILVHCKGGLGRAGTIAARLLVELEVGCEEAVRLVSRARPGAIETDTQMRHVMACRSAVEHQPDRSLASSRDRAIGAMLGLAVGDAVGATLEFRRRDSYPPLTDMIGGGPFRLAPGEWTDDTAMAIGLAEALLSPSGFAETDLMSRFVDWRDNGAYSCAGKCIDIGLTVSAALRRYKRDGNPIAGSSAANSAGNGSLMRLSPVAVRHWTDRSRLREIAARQSRTTHGAAEAVDACVGFAEILADAIAGEPRSRVMRSRKMGHHHRITAILEGEWRNKHRGEIGSSGHVAHSLEAALWCVARSGTFEQAVLRAANLGEDADTTAAITGQLAGALYGASAIPSAWLARLAWVTRLKDLAAGLFVASVDKP